jgi:hypothetical protein
MLFRGQGGSSLRVITPLPKPPVRFTIALKLLSYRIQGRANMKKSKSDQLRELLPELYGPAGVRKKADGMCTPGSGCGPAPEKPVMDIVELLKRAGRNDAQTDETPDRRSKGSDKKKKAAG